MLKSAILLPVSQLSRQFIDGMDDFKNALSSIQKDVPEDFPAEKGDAFHQRVLDAFNASVEVCSEYEKELGNDSPMLRQVQEFFRTETDPWMRQSWIGARARSKPSGFAGDYEMLIKLYEEATPVQGFGAYLDFCILDLPLARAVRSRLTAAKAYLLSEITERDCPLRILDVASGPCREYNDWPELPTCNSVEIVAMDNDPIAIDFVQKNVAAKLTGATKLNVVRYNALRTRNAQATIDRFGRFDIIYSVGLFDYLTDEHLIDVFSGLRGALNDNGSMYIAFKDTERYDKTPYQWHLDWFFFQRTYQDVLNLYAKAGFDLNGIRTTRDATGIIINFISKHHSQTMQRVDASSGLKGTSQVPTQVGSNQQD